MLSLQVCCDGIILSYSLYKGYYIIEEIFIFVSIQFKILLILYLSFIVSNEYNSWVCMLLISLQIGYVKILSEASVLSIKVVVIPNTFSNRISNVGDERRFLHVYLSIVSFIKAGEKVSYIYKCFLCRLLSEILTFNTNCTCNFCYIEV